VCNRNDPEVIRGKFRTTSAEEGFLRLKLKATPFLVHTSVKFKHLKLRKAFRRKFEITGLLVLPSISVCKLKLEERKTFAVLANRMKLFLIDPP